jgi:hypothetical protein
VAGVWKESKGRSSAGHVDFLQRHELFFEDVARIGMRADKGRPAAKQKGETIMKRHFASTAAVALLALPMTLLSNPAWAQKAAPFNQRIPAPLLRRMQKQLIERRLMAKLPPPLAGKLPTQLVGSNPLAAMGSNPFAWMTHLNNVGNQNVANIYKACISHPGACNGLASQQSLNDAIQGVQTQSVINSQHQMVNQNIQTHSINQTNCAVT